MQTTLLLCMSLISHPGCNCVVFLRCALRWCMLLRSGRLLESLLFFKCILSRCVLSIPWHSCRVVALCCGKPGGMEARATQVAWELHPTTSFSPAIINPWHPLLVILLLLLLLLLQYFYTIKQDPVLLHFYCFYSQRLLSTTTPRSPFKPQFSSPRRLIIIQFPLHIRYETCKRQSWKSRCRYWSVNQGIDQNLILMQKCLVHTETFLEPFLKV